MLAVGTSYRGGVGRQGAPSEGAPFGESRTCGGAGRDRSGSGSRARSLPLGPIPVSGAHALHSVRRAGAEGLPRGFPALGGGSARPRRWGPASTFGGSRTALEAGKFLRAVGPRLGSWLSGVASGHALLRRDPRAARRPRVVGRPELVRAASVMPAAPATRAAPAARAALVACPGRNPLRFPPVLSLRQSMISEHLLSLSLSLSLGGLPGFLV